MHYSRQFSPKVRHEAFAKGLFTRRLTSVGAALNVPRDAIKSCIPRNGNMSESGTLATCRLVLRMSANRGISEVSGARSK